MNGHGKSQRFEKSMDVQLPPSRIMLPRVATAESIAEIRTGIGELVVPAVQEVALALPHHPVDAIEKRKGSLGRPRRPPIRPLQVIE
jgi:hypothetical protein